MRDWRAMAYGPTFIRIGARAIRYRESDLESFIERGRVDPSRQSCLIPDSFVEGKAGHAAPREIEESELAARPGRVAGSGGEA
jgi:hypothetical protein